MGRHRRGTIHRHDNELGMTFNARNYWEFLEERGDVVKQGGKWEIISLRGRYRVLSDRTSARLAVRWFRHALQKAKDADYHPTEHEINEMIRYSSDGNFLEKYVDSLLPQV